MNELISDSDDDDRSSNDANDGFEKAHFRLVDEEALIAAADLFFMQDIIMIVVV